VLGTSVFFSRNYRRVPGLPVQYPSGSGDLSVAASLAKSGRVESVSLRRRLSRDWVLGVTLMTR
jgi:hypothetical protein